MKRMICFTVCTVICLAVFCGCSQPKTDDLPAKDTGTATQTETAEAYVLSSNSEKATMTADKEFKTVIQITNTYPGDILCVLEDASIASCEWAQWVNSKGSLMLTGLREGQTVLTVYAGVENDDVTTAKASVSVNVFVEGQPGT